MAEQVRTLPGGALIVELVVSCLANVRLLLTDADLILILHFNLTCLCLLAHENTLETRITRVYAAAGENGFLSLRAYLSLVQVWRHTILCCPAAASSAMTSLLKSKHCHLILFLLCSCLPRGAPQGTVNHHLRNLRGTQQEAEKGNFMPC